MNQESTLGPIPIVDYFYFIKCKQLAFIFYLCIIDATYLHIGRRKENHRTYENLVHAYENSPYQATRT